LHANNLQMSQSGAVLLVCLAACPPTVSVSSNVLAHSTVT
jgi:hypothetical protein